MAVAQKKRRPKSRPPRPKPAAANPWPGDTPWPEALFTLRTKLGLNQTQAAAKVGISQSQWSAFESGARKPTRPIAKLMQLLENGTI